MRRRSTFILDDGFDYDPSDLRLRSRNLSFAGVKAAREERLTIGLADLPSTLVEVLEDTYELHVRWVTEAVHTKSSPYLSALTSGLHVHYTPSAPSISHDTKLCRLLRDIFSDGLECNTPNVSFSRPDILSARFATASSLQYYSLLPSLQHLVTYLHRHVCDFLGDVCRDDVALLNLASYVDFDYDSIGHALVITAYWSQPPAALLDPVGQWTTYDRWKMAVEASPKDKIEVGLFSQAKQAEEPAELQMEGFLVVVGEDQRPKPTMFFFPSRHHVLNQAQTQSQRYSIAFDKPTGLHPTMRISFPSRAMLNQPENKPPGSSCALHAYMTLPSDLFVDEYAFPTIDQDPLFTEAHNVVMLRSLSGERDLEAPDYVIQKWGSALLLELATPNANASQMKTAWDVTIPLHLRYLAPTSGGEQEVFVPWPTIFWACTAEEGTKFTVNPFDRVNLGYDGLFGPRTMFYHLEAHSTNNGTLVEPISVPVLDPDVIGYGVAETLTLIFVLGGFVWIAWKMCKEVSWEIHWWSNSDAKDKHAKGQ